MLKFASTLFSLSKRCDDAAAVISAIQITCIIIINYADYNLFIMNIKSQINGLSLASLLRIS